MINKMLLFQKLFVYILFYSRIRCCKLFNYINIFTIYCNILFNKENTLNSVMALTPTTDWAATEKLKHRLTFK